MVSKANMYAKLMGKTPFVIYQGAWNILQRDFERDIIPMAKSEGNSNFFTLSACGLHVYLTFSFSFSDGFGPVQCSCWW